MRWAIVGILALSTLIPSHARAQARGTISGTVTAAATNRGVPGAQVAIDGTGTATTTNAEGRYTLTGVSAGTYRLTASAPGYALQAAQGVRVVAGQTQTVNFQLQGSAALELEGIVAVGYGTQRKRDVTGAVGSVKMEELEKVQVPTIAQALQGRVAGVQVTQNSSAPGGGVSIRVRGSGSIGSTNEPLYVVDGVPIAGGDNNRPGSDRSRGGTVNPLAFLNPDDIESIEVLKDASSTAIYGARGTNGVVLVTTKKGRAGTSRIEFESSFGMQNVARTMPLLNGTEFAQYANEWAQAEYSTDPARLAQLGGIPYPDLNNLPVALDYQDMIYRSAPIQDYNVSVLGGTEATRFALSGNYSAQDGIVRGSSFQRYSMRANVQHEAKSWLTLGSNLNITRLTPELGFTDAAQARAAASAVNAATAFVPFMPIYNANGQYTWMDRDFLPELARLGVNGTNYENPMAIINEGFDEAEYDRVLGNAFADFNLLEGLTFRLNGGADIVNNQRSEYFTSLSRRGGQANNGVAEIGIIDQSHYLAEAILNYKRAFGDIHNLDFTAGTTYESENQYTKVLSSRNFPNDITKFYNIDAGTPVGGPTTTSDWDDWTLLSYLGRINYGLADKYLLTLTGRADGSSKFGADNKWGFFPSAALAWRASEEPFLQDASWLSDLKLRLSYGKTGNQEIGVYQSLARMAGSNYNFGGVMYSGFRPDNVANPELRWEKSKQFDAGFDAALFDNRITLTFDVYQKDTEDLLLSIPLPAETGFTSALQNLGTVRNRGVELGLGVDLLDAIDGGFGWRTSLNVSHNRNRVVEIGDREEFFGGNISGDMKVGGLLVREGEPMGVFFGYKTDGVFNTQAEADAYVGTDGTPILPGAVAGQRKLVDTNGDGKISEADRTILGNPEPDFALGWSNDMSLGRFSLYTFFQGTVGNEVFNVNAQEFTEGGVGRNYWKPAWEDRWTPENTDAAWPVINLAPGVGYAFGTSGDVFDTFVEDGSYFRLRSLTLSFDVPEDYVGRLGGMQSARLYFNAENVFTLTGYTGFNPDVNTAGQNNINRGVDLGAYPLARTYRIGIRMGL